MSNKTLCPGCDTKTSAVYQAVLDGQPCPYCGLPADAIEKVESVRRSHADAALRAENERLVIENGKLTAERDDLARKVEGVRRALERDESNDYSP